VGAGRGRRAKIPQGSLFSSRPCLYHFFPAVSPPQKHYRFYTVSKRDTA
jgi:hypothetical protein